MAEADDAAKTPAGHWKAQIEAAQKETRDWHKQGREVVKRYLDERPSESQGTRYNILWSNTQVLLPATYGQTPQPIVKRRHDVKDPVGRETAEILERCLVYGLDEYEFDDAMEEAVQDMLLPGLGVARIVYEAEYEDRESEVEGAEPYQVVASEKVCAEHVYWEDFLWSPARRWANVSWVAFRWKLTRPELEKRFGKDIANKVKLDWSPESGSEADSTLTPKEGEDRRASGWEIWDKTKRRVVWIARSCNEILDEKPDPLHLHGFFPCPQPLIEGATTSRWLPQPDYLQYQDQARELDLITAKITALTDGLKVVGLYAGSEKATLNRLLAEAKNNTLIPVADWAALQAKGGMSGLIEWLPIEQVVNVLASLYEARERVKADLYEITGIGDIIRGASDPRETLGAQQIKSRFATLRMEKRQKKVARFARDLIRLQAEVIAEMFDARTLIDMSGKELPLTRAEALSMAAPVPQVASMPSVPGAQPGLPAAPMQPVQHAPPPVPATWEDVIGLLRSDRLRSFRVDIETDSTIAPNPQEEQARRIEFMGAVGSFLKEVAPMVQAGAIPGDVAKEMLSFTVRGFRVGRNLESTLDEIEAPQSVGPKPDPEMAKVEAQLRIEAQKLEAQQKLKEAEFAHDAEMEARRFTLEREKMAADLRLSRDKAGAELALKREQIAASAKPAVTLAFDKEGRAVQNADDMIGGVQQVMQTLAAFMQAQAQRDQAQEQQIAALVQAMARPRQKQISLVRENGQVVGADVMEQ